jgi:glycosyltransferase involved in cell wall biosynthesis
VRNISVALVGPDVNGRAPGGMAAISLSLSNSLNCLDGFSVQTISNFDEGGVGRRIWASLRAAVQLVLSRKSTDVVHFQVATGLSIERELALALVARGLGLSVVAQFHGAGQIEDYRNGTALHKACCRLLMRLSSCNMALGSHAYQWIVETAGDRPAALVPNGVQVHEEPKPFSGGTGVVLFVGRMGERKGTFDLLQAVGQLIGEGTELKLVLAGDGDRDGVQRMLDRDSALSERVSVLGWRSTQEVQALMQEAWVLALPSYAEGLPMAVLEAMASGRAVIVGRVGEVEDMVDDGVTGRLVEPGDIDGLTSALKDVLADRDWAEQAGREGLRLVRDKFDKDQIVSALCQIYEDAAAAR